MAVSRLPECSWLPYRQSLSVGSQSDTNSWRGFRPLRFGAYASVTLLRDIAVEHHRLTGDDGWVDLSVLGARLRKVRPGFQPSDYGAGKLKSLLRSCGPQVEIDTAHGTGRVRMRSGEA